MNKQDLIFHVKIDINHIYGYLGLIIRLEYEQIHNPLQEHNGHIDKLSRVPYNIRSSSISKKPH